MKKVLCLLLTCLLLTGCAPETSLETSPPAQEAVPSGTESVRLYAPGHPLESCAPGALRVYPLAEPCHGIVAVGEDLIALCGKETTTLTLLQGEDLVISACAALPFRLDSLQTQTDGLSFFDPLRRETVLLSGKLKEVGRIAAPQGMVGVPTLSRDCSTLYYCTPTAIRAWDLDSGIRRCVKEMAYDSQSVTALHQEDSVLQCRIVTGGEVRTLFLAADTGRLIQEVSGDITLVAQGDSWYASVPEGPAQLQLFGQAGESPQLLTPEDVYAQCWYLEKPHCVIAVSGSVLNGYSPEFGFHFASLELPVGYEVRSITDCGEDAVYLLIRDPAGNHLICRWELYSDASFVNDSRRYLGPRYTKEAPDASALAKCQAEALRLGNKYGIRILVWEDALSAQPWDYKFQPEYLAPVLEREMADLDRRLGYYPPEILDGIRAHFSQLSICLVRSIQGAPESGSLEKATGVQFCDGTDAAIAIAVGKHGERALYHELYHVMETRLLTDSAALDRWDGLNPKGFSYDLDLERNKTRQSGEYLQPDTRAFIDTYSMSFPKEDRARIMECAMSDGKASLFRSQTMQKKLSCLSQAIREAYGLKNSTEVFRWEQYLK